MHFVNNRLVTAVTFVSFCFMGVLPASAREKIALDLVVNKYNQAVIAYNTKGPEAFINTFSEIPESDRHEFLQLFKGQPTLPELTLVGDKFALKVAGGENHSIRVVGDAADANFEIDGVAFSYNRAASFESNVDQIKSHFKDPTVSWLNFLIPNAFAMWSPWIIGLIGGVVIGLIAYMFKKKKSPNDVKNDVEKKVKDDFRGHFKHDKNDDKDNDDN